MNTSLERFKFLTPEITDNPYLTFPVAVERGVLIDPEAKARPLNDPAGVTIANGFIPNAHQAGLVDAGDEVMAFDLASLDLSEGKIRISPAPKSSVDSNGHITNEGVVVLQNQTGLLRFVAFAIDATKRPWLANHLRPPRVQRRSQEKISLFGARVLELPDLELTEVDLTTNSVMVKFCANYY